MPTKEEFVRSAEARIIEIAKDCKIEYSPLLAAAILGELRTMYDMGKEELRIKATKPTE